MNTTRKKMAGYLDGILLVLGVILCSYHLSAAMLGTITVMRQRVFHVGLVLLITLFTTLRKRLDNPKWNPGKLLILWEMVSDLVLFFFAVTGTIYLYIVDESIYLHVFRPTRLDVLLGAGMVFSVLEITRRLIGAIMPSIGLCAILYAKFGDLLPAAAANKGYSLRRIFSYLFLSQDGIYGTPTGVSAQVVIMFVIFGAFLTYSGAGKAFIDLSYSLFGRFRGGPAKVSVIASALFGMINGSAIANVASTGSLTIPLMKKVGYSPEDAGGICAVASTGGQIMPPIMGAAAFIMAETIGVNYRVIALSAAIPALLYFFQVFFVVDMLAVKDGLKGLSADALPDGKKILRTEGFLLLPIILLIVLLCIIQWSSSTSALWAIGCALVVSWFTPDHKMKIKEICHAFAEAAGEICSVALACSTAGIAIGMLSLTGLGLKMSSLLVALSGDNLLVLMVLTMVAGIILGMGLPTSGVYIILSVLAAPALVKLHVAPLSAHMFVFYFGVIAAITPPVALASYAGAGIAGADTNKTGWRAVKIGLAGFLLPYMFIFRPSILAQGSPFEIIQTALIAALAIAALSAAMYGMPSSRKLPRVIMGISAFILLSPGIVSDIAGLVLLAVGYFLARKMPDGLMRKSAV